jgi:hypothetical protein
MPRTDPRFDQLRPVTCASCGACVLVAKFSLEHTTVQWDAAAMQTCLELRATDRLGALVPGCVSLRSSIEDAVTHGRLTVAPP